MKRRFSKSSLFSILMILMLFISACSTEQSSSSGGKGSSKEDVIKIGAIFSETGPASTLGKTQAEYVKVLQEKLDEEGPIDGKKIEIVMQDYETDDTKAVVAADKLISEGVVAIVGATQASTTMAIHPKVTAAGLPLMAVAPADPDTKGMYQMAPVNSVSAKLMVDFLKERNLKKIAWINARDGFGVDGLPYFEEAAKKAGIEIVAHEEFDATATDMTIQLTNLRKADPEAIIVWSRTPGAGIVARNFKDLGFDIPMIQSNAASNQGFLDQVKDDNENIFVMSSKLNVVDQLPEGQQKETLSAFRNEYKEVIGSEPDNFTGHAADGFNLILEAIRAGHTTPEKINDYLKENVKEYQGLSGTFNFAADEVGPNEDGFAIVGIENNTWKYLD
jgi:branched-chain amino acid transport system substrate-binding protein